MRIITVVLIAFLMSGCSLIEDMRQNEPDALLKSDHPLKTRQDIRTEKLLIGGVWKYQRQDDDCKDTEWQQTFYKNRYYRSGGAACLLKDAFSVDAENWHVKKTMLYITNLAPDAGDDIILRYTIKHLSKGKMILHSNGFDYTFLK
ncbi:MAG TPA: hypothetical protein EYG71_02870 [Leucothrix sp.]|nr:hypothetical protein [Leucothrix sp.]